MAPKHLPALYPSRHHAMNREAKKLYSTPVRRRKKQLHRPAALRPVSRLACPSAACTWPPRLIHFRASDFEQVLSLRTCA